MGPHPVPEAAHQPQCLASGNGSGARHLSGHSGQSVFAQGCSEAGGPHPATTMEIIITREG